MTEEQKRRMLEGRRRWAEAKARGENPPLSRGAKRRRAKRAENGAAQRAAIARQEAAAARMESFGEVGTGDDTEATPEIAATPEFNAAVEKALAERLPAMFAALAQANGHAQDQSPASFANALALQMAKFTGQGTGKTYVDPEELERRAAGRREMMRLLKECRETQQIPSYRVIRQTQLDVPPFGPIVIEPLWRAPDRSPHDTEIDFLWIPNLAMVPLNEPAKRVFAQFEVWIGAEMPEVSDPENLDATIAAIAGPTTQLGQYGLSYTGTVVRGAAAAAAARQVDPSLHGGFHMSPHQAAMIRRGEDPAVRKKQVLGTLTDPIEMR